MYVHQKLRKAFLLVFSGSKLKSLYMCQAQQLETQYLRKYLIPPLSVNGHEKESIFEIYIYSKQGEGNVFIIIHPLTFSLI